MFLEYCLQLFPPFSSDHSVLWVECPAKILGNLLPIEQKEELGQEKNKYCNYFSNWLSCPVKQYWGCDRGWTGKMWSKQNLSELVAMLQQGGLGSVIIIIITLDTYHDSCQCLVSRYRGILGISNLNWLGLKTRDRRKTSNNLCPNMMDMIENQMNHPSVYKRVIDGPTWFIWFSLRALNLRQSLNLLDILSLLA